MSNHINILGVNISVINKNEVLNKIEQYLKGGKQHFIVTPNPEFILAAHEDEEFFHVLNQADLAVPDGFGLKCAAWVMGKNIYRYPGADMVKDILRIAQDRGSKIAVLNWRGGLSGADDIKKVLTKKYRGLQFRVEDIDRGKGAQLRILGVELLKEFCPEIIFITLGAPYQEKFIFHNLKKIPSARLVIGVGGALDFLTGKIKRAPRFLRILGIEWLWRLSKQPWRWRRIYNAVVIFTIKFIKWRFILPFRYRKNVSCLLYKGINGKCQILLVERAEQSGHWQLPQGGLDELDILEAGVKELYEEINTKNIKPIKYYPNLYKYKFGSREGESGYRAAISQKYIGYRGQIQSLLIAEFLGKDDEIKINYWDHSAWKWVDSANLVNEVHPVRKEATKIFLDKFNQVIKKYEAENKKIYLSY